jgi:phosphoglycerol transferase MdoB-like AlkP superfamily enzyme
MAGKIKKVLESIFSNNIVISILFWIFAILPLVTSDIVLRYVLNPIRLNNSYVFVPILFNLFWIVLILYICKFILPKKIGRIIYVIFTLIFGFWFFVNFISFKMFSKYLWVETVFLFSEAKNYASAVWQYIDIKVFLVGIIYIGSIILTCIMWQERKIKNRILRVIPAILSIIGILGVNAYMGIALNKDKAGGAWEVWDKPTLVYDKFADSNKSLNIAGIYQYTFKSIYKIFANNNKVLPEKEKMVDDFFEGKSIKKENEMTGILKDKNVVFVLMESIDSWMINDKYMPTVKYMMENGINFANHYMPNVGVGYTVNAEFAANTGFYCPSTETSASIFTKNSFPYALANMANEKGYVGTSFHFNGKNFYNRLALHRQFGYRDYKSFMDYLSIEKCVQDSEAVKSDKIYGMMTGNDKFLDFIITYSVHLPYDKEDNKLKGAMANYPDLIDESLDLETRNALLLAHDTDEFFRILLKRLEEDKLLDNTVIIAFTDHYSYGISDKKKVLELRGEDEDAIIEKVPFFIYSPGLKPKEVKKVTSTIDILPTIANMLGFENNGYYLGEDAFDSNYKGLVYFPNGNWYDGNIYYKDGQAVAEDNKEYIDETNKYIAKLVDINDYVILTNYFSRLKLK